MVKALYPLLIEASEPWWENASDENALAHLKARFAPKA
jgi:hypothetical protein